LDCDGSSAWPPSALQRRIKTTPDGQESLTVQVSAAKHDHGMQKTPHTTTGIAKRQDPIHRRSFGQMLFMAGY
jgi:hypothetical protein